MNLATDVLSVYLSSLLNAVNLICVVNNCGKYCECLLKEQLYLLPELVIIQGR